MFTRGALALAVALALLSCRDDGGDARPDAAPTTVEQAPFATERIAGDIAAIARPRNAIAQPEALAEVAEHIEGQLRSAGYEPEREAVPAVDADSWNIVADLRGDDCPQHIVIVGAHYDSVAESPGAVDNASGVAAVLEIARAMAGHPLPPTVRFVLFTMEEEGLIGSRAMARELADRGASIDLMLSLDMVGYTTPDARSVFVFGDDDAGAFVEAVRNAAVSTPAPVEVVAFTVGQWPSIAELFRNSDQEAFWANGYPAVQVTNSRERMPFYHGPGDLPDTVDLQFTASIARALFQAMGESLTCQAAGGDNS